MAEGLFNLVLAWTLLFAPLLFTDCRRDRYKGSLDVLWGFQMFLTNSMISLENKKKTSLFMDRRLPNSISLSSLQLS